MTDSGITEGDASSDANGIRNDRPESFEDLAASRREWIENVLRPWCQRAGQRELRQAESEWHNFAGRVDIVATLWTWAWERFPALTYQDLAGVNETQEVCVTLKDGTSVHGFPDSRLSQRGTLVLISRDPESGVSTQHGPISIDDIASVIRGQ